MGNYGQSQLSRMVHEILKTTLANELNEMSDKYDIPVEKIEDIAISLYVQDASKSQWKSSNTKFIKIFENETKSLLEKGVLNWQELGFINFLAINFTSFEDSSLRNPDGSYATQKDIVIMSKSSKPTVSRMLKGLIQKQIVFEKKHGEIRGAKRYFLSPYIIYRGRMMDKKLKTRLVELKDHFKETWNRSDSELDKDEVSEKLNNISANIENDDFLQSIEESIVEEFYEEKYSQLSNSI